MASNPMRSLTQQLLDKNSEAVLCMQRQDFAGSVQILLGCCLQQLPGLVTAVASLSYFGSRGLAYTLDIEQEDQSTGPGEYPNVENASPDDAATQPTCIVMATYVVPLNVGSPQRRQEALDACAAQNGFQFFDQAIVTACLDCADGEVPPAFIRAMLLYNMGLALQQSVLLPGRDRLYLPFRTPQEDPLHLAAELYEGSLAILYDLSSIAPFNGMGTIQEDDVALMVLALNNNLAHIQVTLCNDLRALASVDDMRFLLHYTSMSQSSIIAGNTPPRPFHICPARKFFYQNVVTIPATTTVCTSGAA